MKEITHLDVGRANHQPHRIVVIPLFLSNSRNLLIEHAGLPCLVSDAQSLKVVGARVRCFAENEYGTVRELQERLNRVESHVSIHRDSVGLVDRMQASQCFGRRR